MQFNSDLLVIQGCHKISINLITNYIVLNNAIPLPNHHLTPPTPLIILCFVKCFSHIIVLLHTRKPSLQCWRLIKLHQCAFAGFFIGNLKKCKPNTLSSLLYSNYYTQLLHTPFHGFVVSLSCFLCLSLGPFSRIYSTQAAAHKQSKGKSKGRKESKYRVSLIQKLQKLRRLDQNQVVS